jgi:tripartite-type tricarboxylate transporter receptor subunit TctC
MRRAQCLSLLITIFLCPAFFCVGTLSAADFPNKPINMVMWTSAGMADTVTRHLCKTVEKDLGQPITIVAKEGAAGAIAINYILNSKPDGYTIGMAMTSNLFIAPHVRPLPYDVRSSVLDICGIIKYNYGLAVRTSAPWNTWEELLAYVKKNPGKFTYTGSGVGSTQHIAMERIAMKEGMKWTHVPTKSGNESVVTCLGGHTDGVVQASIELLPHVKAGALKMLLIVNDSRWPGVPDVPQIKEKGYDFSALGYMSYFGPKGMPEEIRQRLEGAFKKAMEDPSFQKLLETFGVQPAFMPGKDYSTLWRSQYDEMGKVVKALGLLDK